MSAGVMHCMVTLSEAWESIMNIKSEYEYYSKWTSRPSKWLGKHKQAQRIMPQKNSKNIVKEHYSFNKKLYYVAPKWLRCFFICIFT
jgi:hypothetical protein